MRRPASAQALLSVSDKTGLVEFARGLAARGVALLSTGGTAQALADAGLAVTDVGTLHRLSGDARRPRQDAPSEGARRHPRAPRPARARGGAARRTASRRSTSSWSTSIRSARPSRNPACTLEDAIENIDIGGPSMVRAAAKNWPHVGIVVDPADYADGARRARRRTTARCPTPRASRLMRKAFAHTAAYDGAIANWLTARDADGTATALARRRSTSSGTKVQDLRYGENPHQSAAFYRDELPAPGSIATYRQLQGKELSYNNIADSDAAWECVKTFAEPACVIVKHANPCGVAIADTPLDAYRKAFADRSRRRRSAASSRSTVRSTRDRRGRRRAVRRGADRAGVHGRRARADRQEGERARAADRHCRADGGARNACDMKRVGGGLLRADARHRATSRRAAAAS